MLKQLKPEALLKIGRDKRFLWLVKASLGAVVLLYIFRSIDLGVFWRTAGTVRPAPFVIALVLFYPPHLIAAWRWQYILAQGGNRVPFWSVFRYVIWGQASALALPGQLSGDIVRALAIVQDQEHKSRFVLSVIVDKFSVLIWILAFVVLGVGVPRLATEYGSILLLATISLAGALGIFWLLVRRGPLLSALSSQLARSLHAEKYLARGQGAEIHLSLKEIAIVLGLALLVQLFNSVGSYSLALAFSIQLDPLAWAAIGAMVSFVQMIPLTVGGIGIREGLFVALLALFGVPAEQSVAYSLFGFVCVAVLLVAAWTGIEWVYPRYPAASPSPETLRSDP